MVGSVEGGSERAPAAMIMAAASAFRAEKVKALTGAGSGYHPVASTSHPGAQAAAFHPGSRVNTAPTTPVKQTPPAPAYPAAGSGQGLRFVHFSAQPMPHFPLAPYKATSVSLKLCST